MRGKVKVSGYSDGPIPWPIKWKTRKSLILCGDLVKAVRTESEVAIAHHWGVCVGTVKKWRANQEVEFYNPGTRQLQHAVALEHALPSKHPSPVYKCSIAGDGQFASFEILHPDFPGRRMEVNVVMADVEM